jgi:ubiquinone/menaquinone biosynthesis C-methylase UbiE
MITTEASKIRKAWDGIAVNFDRYVTPTANWVLAKTALRLAGLKPGMHFLDVASGSGALSLPAARLGAKVLAVDISPVMIERLKARADEEGLAHLKGQVMDGHHLDLNDSTFDIAGSQFGVMLFPDFHRGLNELVRVTRPGGTVFLVTFGPHTKGRISRYVYTGCSRGCTRFYRFVTRHTPAAVPGIG